jgi:GNAT superfamily N-acetyltransferase
VITVKTLSRDDVEKIKDIDRTEKVTVGYEVRDGTLCGLDVDWDVPPWTAEHAAKLIDKTAFEVERGGAFLGALDGDLLVGFAVLAHKFLGDGPDTIQLAIEHVSRAYRRQGVGTRLLKEASDLARERGAKHLYISATPSASAVGFYLKHGCRLTPNIDEELFALEPEDIHLIMDL